MPEGMLADETIKNLIREIVQNRDFEYKYRKVGGNAPYAVTVYGSSTSATVCGTSWENAAKKALAKLESKTASHPADA